jgi:lipoprotein-releasing system permease protein
MTLPFEYFIGRRYLGTRNRQAFISLINLLAIAAVTLGVTTLMVVIAVMTGTEHEMTSRILGVQPHILVLHHGAPMGDYRNAAARIESLKGVTSATPFVYSQIMLRTASGISGAMIKGIPPQAARDVMTGPGGLTSGLHFSTDADGGQTQRIPEIVLGKALAEELGLAAGDAVDLITARGTASLVSHVPAMRRFRVTGLFDSGFHDYDKAFAYVHMADAQDILKLGDKATGLDVRLADVFASEDIAKKINAELAFPYWARDWRRSNRNLFASLKLQKTVMFIIFSLIVIVAGFCIASSLIMTVTEKTRDIAILKAMGATKKSIGLIFVFKGMVIGLVGTLLGISAGYIICVLLRHYRFIQLPEDIYYFSTLPVRIEILDISVICAAALLVCLSATLYPALRASRLDPVEGIRM